ncbi:ferredoxin--nitrite reductase [Synechococcus sp. CS-1324]|uniref:ferredoxin--nitrite reductase n=1 Tax=unclassified Synechococcus TaxID=2626047 RepID=UPI000DB06A86|nr:ferredoxin--nitrite reductase [Synechococcus sp. CS-1326]MCT0231242.1 ferredoxin--nitrite reductase [Synechococcus sp. CS-1324]MCT0234402.1 ferredoxin--nitrite reductase [Synechococcus sp. CS-1327]PZV03866.1 MAG: ferredoxin--nitrite reductase [Cyanobium sp.]
MPLSQSSPEATPLVASSKRSKVEQAKADFCGLALEPRLAELGQAGWESLDEATLTIHLKWLGIFFRPVTPGRFMVRLRLPNGLIQADQLDVLAEAVDRCGDHGSADITTRQNLQLRGLLLEDMGPLVTAMAAVGLTSRQSGHDNPRNVTGNPLAGIDPEEFVDTRPLVDAIQDVLLGPEGPKNLPRKFNVAVGGAPDSFLLHNDLAFLPAHRDGDQSAELGFTVLVGGFFSAQRNTLAIPLGLWLRGDQLPEFSLAVLRHYERQGDRSNRNKTRLMYLIDALGIERYRNEVLDTYGEFAGAAAAAAVSRHDGSHLVDRAPRDICGVHAQRQDGLHWVGLHVPMGRLEASGMALLSRLARIYGSGQLRFSESQNVLICDVPGERLEALLAEPLLQRFRVEPGPLEAEAVSCTGNRYCSFALIPTKSTAQAVVEELERRLELPQAVRTHWTGCPNACGQPYMGEIGLMGAKARLDGQMVEAAKIFLGGSMAAEPRLGELHDKPIPLSQLSDVLETLLVERFGARRRPGV